MIKSVFVMNLKSMNFLPPMERWYIRYHAPETMHLIGQWLTHYVSYRAAPPAPGAEPYGYYNYRVTELWYRGLNDMPGPGGSPAFTWIPNQMDIMGLPGKMPYTTDWDARPEGPHPPAQCLVPARPTENFFGMQLGSEEKSILRWYTVFKYPKGVPVEEGEKWFLEVHSKEVMKQPGLIRYFSHRCVSQPGRPAQYPWHRLSEQWYENNDGWRQSIIEAPPRYTKPPWATYDKYPFLEPFVDFVSTFILERPTDDFLRDWRPFW
jgi:hypothetical protein